MTTLPLLNCEQRLRYEYEARNNCLGNELLMLTDEFTGYDMCVSEKRKKEVRKMLSKTRSGKEYKPRKVRKHIIMEKLSSLIDLNEEPSEEFERLFEKLKRL